MPHPTPAQIAYGSATVVSTTLLLLLLAPNAPTPVVSLIAAGALLLGVAVAVLLRPRRAHPPGPPLVPAQRTERSPVATGASPPHPALREHASDAARPEVSV
jgi:hypothetical protein